MKKLYLIKKELVIILIAILIYVFRGIPFIYILRPFFESEDVCMYISILLSSIMIYIIFSNVYEKWECGEDDISFSWKSFKVRVIGTAALFVIAILLSQISAFLMNLGVSENIVDSNLGSEFENISTIGLVLLLLNTAFFAPMIEELIFRGLLFSSLCKVFSLRKAIIISSICFGLLHGTSVMTVITTTLAGIVLAYTFAVNRNLMDSVFPHMMYNTFVVYMAVNILPAAT